jgi:hypothetical protein
MTDQIATGQVVTVNALSTMIALTTATEMAAMKEAVSGQEVNDHGTPDPLVTDHRETDLMVTDLTATEMEMKDQETTETAVKDREADLLSKGHLTQEGKDLALKSLTATGKADQNRPADLSGKTLIRSKPNQPSVNLFTV